MRLQNITVGITAGLQKIAVGITLRLRWDYREITGITVGVPKICCLYVGITLRLLGLQWDYIYLFKTVLHIDTVSSPLFRAVRFQTIFYEQNLILKRKCYVYRK